MNLWLAGLYGFGVLGLLILVMIIFGRNTDEDNEGYEENPNKK